MAYEGLLISRRQALHAAAGQALEWLYNDRLEDAYDRLAYHYARTEFTDKAVLYLTRFAEKAAGAYAHVEAASAIQEALSHAERLPGADRERQILQLVLRLVHSLYFLGRLPESLDGLLQQQERVERLQEAALAGVYYFWLGHTYTLLGQQEQAATHGRRAMIAAQSCHDVATMSKAAYILARADYWTGQYPTGIEYCKQAIALLEQTSESWWLGQSYWLLGSLYTFQGAWEVALEAFARADAIGGSIGDPRLQTYAAWGTGRLHGTIGNWEEGIAACQRSLERSPDPVNTAVALGFLGFVYMEKGDTAAVAVLEQAIQRQHQFRVRQMEGWFITFLGEAYRLQGEHAKAYDLVQQGLDIARDTRTPFVVGWSQRALGRVALAQGTLAEAASYLQAALHTSTAIQARLEVGRTHLDLAALAHASGNREATATHVQVALKLFTVLRVPRYVECSAQLAAEFGVSLNEEMSREHM